MKHNIYFVKTAKCATETIRKYLIQYSNKNKFVYNDFKFKDFYRKTNFNIVTNHIFNDERSLNHFNENKNVDIPTIYLTAIRNPINRLYSHYCYGHPYFKKGMDFNEWYIKTIKGELPEIWPASYWGDRTTNYISHYMNVKSVEEFENFFNFVFVKEEFEKSLTLFEKTLNFKFDRMEKQINQNPQSKKDYVFDKEVIDLFDEHNELDNLLYKKSIEKLNDFR